MQSLNTELFANKHILIVGFGRSGQAVARFLKQRQITFAISDTQAPDSLAMAGASAIETNGHSVDFFSSYNLFIVSPGVARATLPQLPPQAEIICDIELAFLLCKTPIVAITGTNGKTTTTQLVHALANALGLRCKVAGNIGIPVLDVIDDSLDFLILELSSFQLEYTTSFHAVVAIYLNLSPDHLDRYTDTNAYHAAKCRIFNNQITSDTAIINANDPLLCQLSTTAKRHFFNLANKHNDPQRCGSSANSQTLTLTNKNTCTHLSLSRWQMVGQHNRDNLQAAILASQAMLKISNSPHDFCFKTIIEDAFATFIPPAHRCHIFAQYPNKISFIDDSKATNFDACIHAITSFAQPKVNLVVLLGGIAKEANFELLKKTIAQHVKHLVCFGKDGKMIARQLQASTPSITLCPSLAMAIDVIITLAKPDTTVLLSPACASFDEFANYSERGLFFQRQIEAKFGPTSDSHQAN